jgi:argininosuccinate lyase
MILFSTQEYGFIEIPEAYSTGSSAMPQKKNPDLLELVRAKAARVLGNQSALLISVKGLPLAYNKDLQEMQEPLFEATAIVFSILPLVTGWMRAVGFNRARMQQAADSGFMNAWAAATYLVGRGVPSRLSHEHVGKAVRVCVERGCELQDLPLEELREINPVFDQDFYSCLTLKAVLAIHDVVGGTAAARVQKALQRARRQAAALRSEVEVDATA